MKSRTSRSGSMLSAVCTMMALLASSLHAQWEPDVRLTLNDSASYTSQTNARCVAASGDTVHVVWYDLRDGNREIYYKRSRDGGATWETDRRLTSNDSASFSPSVAASASYVHLVWFDRRDGNYEIYYKRSTTWGASWGTDTRLTSNDSSSYYPSVASGDYVYAVWMDRRNGNHEIYAKRSTNGGASWGTDTRLTANDSSSEYPSVATASNGFSDDVHVVWMDLRDGNREIYYKRSTNGGDSWGADVRLTSDDSTSYYPSVASGGSNVHVIWFDRRDGNYEIYYKRSQDRGATWGPDVRLTNSSGTSWYPSVTAGRVTGSPVHVVWADARDGNAEIYYKRSTNWGTAWDPDTRLTVNSGESWHPSVATATGNDKVHVVWWDNRDGNKEIYYKHSLSEGSGVEGTGVGPGQTVPARIKPTPNPFTSFATIPGHETERFALYDVAGRLVDVCKGNRIGGDLAPGVYFVKGEAAVAAPTRIVKIR